MTKSKYPVAGIIFIFLLFVLALVLLVRTWAVREQSSPLVSPAPTYFVFPSMAESSGVSGEKLWDSGDLDDRAW